MKILTSVIIGVAAILPLESAKSCPQCGHHNGHYSSRHYYTSAYATTTAPVYRSYPNRSAHYYRSCPDSIEVDVQRELARRGYYQGYIDGVIGAGSRAAIRAFQSANGLCVTGHIDTDLLRALDLR